MNVLSLGHLHINCSVQSWLCVLFRFVFDTGKRSEPLFTTNVWLWRRSSLSCRFQRRLCHPDIRERCLWQDNACSYRRLLSDDTSHGVSPCSQSDHYSHVRYAQTVGLITSQSVSRCPCLSVFSRSSTVVFVRRLSVCLWFPSPVIWFTDVCRSTCTQHVWWPVLCYCRAAGLELFAGWTAKLWLS